MPPEFATLSLLGIRFTPGPFDRWRSSAGSNRLAAIKKPLLGARIRSIAHKRLIGNNGKRLECGTQQRPVTAFNRFALFRTLSRSAHRFVPRMFSKTAIIGLIGTQTTLARGGGSNVCKTKKHAPKSGAVWTCLPTRRLGPRSRATTAMLAATEHMAMQKYSRTKSKRAWQKQLSRKEPRRGLLPFTFTFIRAAESKGLMSPKEAHTGI